MNHGPFAKETLSVDEVIKLFDTMARAARDSFLDDFPAPSHFSDTYVENWLTEPPTLFSYNILCTSFIQKQ